MTNHDLAYYMQCFDHLSVNKKGGQLAPHKPLLLLAVIDLVECGIIRSPQIELSEALIGDVTHRVALRKLTEHHAHELAPSVITLAMLVCACCPDYFSDVFFRQSADYLRKKCYLCHIKRG